jgi:hypothetical protein
MLMPWIFLLLAQCACKIRVCCRSVFPNTSCVYVCVCVCVRARVRACVRWRARACARARPCDFSTLCFLCSQEVLIPCLGINSHSNRSKVTENYHTFTNPLPVNNFNTETNLNLHLGFYCVRIQHL